MNGDVNGTMEEPIELSLPTSLSNKPSQEKVTSEDCDDITDNCENRNNIATSNHGDGDGDSSNHSTNDGITTGSLNDNSHESDSQLPQKFSTPELSEDDTNNSIQNNCENSNELGPTTDCHNNTSNTVEKQNADDINDNNKEKDCNSDHDVKQTIIDDLDMESEEESSIENISSSGEQKADDLVSIHSDSDDDGDETSQESQTKNRSSDIIILDSENLPAQNGNSNDLEPEVHEIESDNDDCVVACEDKPSVAKDKLPLRRSSRRSVKRRKYDDSIHNGGESDVEEVEVHDSSSRKGKPIVINDTKTLVEMAAKQIKGNNHKKEPTVVIIDTNSSSSPKQMSAAAKNRTATSNSVSSAQSLYQSIVARGTTVTPVSVKSNAATQASQATQPPILPSLTDDMFVVEAPSFIVPYVYEKPSIKPFREFVFKLGKELEEQKKREKTEEQAKKAQDVAKEKEDGDQDDLEDSEVENDSQSPRKSDTPEVSEKKKSDRKEKRKQITNHDDDGSWDGTSDSDTEGVLSEDEKSLSKKRVVTLAEFDDKNIDQIKNVTELTADKICSSKAVPSSMDCSLGKFFIDIGLNLVQEYVQNDLLKQQSRKLYKEKKSGQNTKATESSIAQLKKNLEFSKENNAPYVQPQKKCEFCSFKTESMLAMANHLETPHMKNNMYKCNFCSYEVRTPHDILFHMEAEHNIRGKLERALSYRQCPNCPFEDNGKGKMARHLLVCAKKFRPETNLCPPFDWEPPAKIPKIAKPRNNIMTPYQSTMNRGQMVNAIRTPLNMAAMGLAGASAGGFRARGRSLLPPRGVPILRGIRQTSPILMPNNIATANATKPKPSHPSISITPLPRQPQPQVQQPAPTAVTKSTFVICEICDGYIKDLEQLRNHMQWIHKVKIHPKMIYNRPPLNCQKCQFRFFTDQGLERHLLGSHGLVTSSMQEAANKGKDAGRCPVCGRVYQWKLLNHVATDHNLTLKPAHLSYKCTVCTATFGMYKQFESHVYSAHSVVAKRAMDKSKPSAPPTKGNGDARAKPLKINDEITVIPQTAKSTSAKEK